MEVFYRLEFPFPDEHEAFVQLRSSVPRTSWHTDLAAELTAAQARCVDLYCNAPGLSDDVFALLATVLHKHPTVKQLNYRGHMLSNAAVRTLVSIESLEYLDLTLKNLPGCATDIVRALLDPRSKMRDLTLRYWPNDVAEFAALLAHPNCQLRSFMLCFPHEVRMHDNDVRTYCDALRNNFVICSVSGIPGAMAIISRNQAIRDARADRCEAVALAFLAICRRKRREVPRDIARLVGQHIWATRLAEEWE